MLLNYMSHFMAKYILGVTGIVFAFGNFVACGSQFYRVSLEDDFDARRVVESNPEALNPDSTLYGIHAISGWHSLPIAIRFDPEMNAEQKSHFLAAAQKWEWAVGKKLFAYHGIHQGVTGDSFDDLFSSLPDQINGNYLDNDWEKTDKPSHVLATAIWANTANRNVIATADIRFNNEHYLIGDSLTLRRDGGRQVVDMQSLALHEIGHFLGLAHASQEVDSHSIMNPTLFIGEGLTSRQLSRGDIERIQLIYGCDGIACDINTLMREAQNNTLDKKFTKSAKLWLQTGAQTSPVRTDENGTYIVAH